MRALKFLLGILVGSMIGASLVLLVAPQSGEDTQKKVAEKMEMLLAEGKKAFEARRAELEAQMNALQQR